MTLLQVIKAFELVASNQPSVNMIVENDIFRLNSLSDARYGVFGWTQGVHSGSIDSSMMNFQFTFFYVDRLTANLGNQIEVQSVGVDTLGNIIRELENKGIFVENTFTMQTFNQRFLDECAGVFCNLTLSVPVTSACADSFGGDYNEDFNEDFLIY